MYPLIALCALAVLASFGLYALRRARPADVPAVLTGSARPVVVLVLATLALLLADPADLPTLLRAALRALGH
ncbi:hypothetical protein M8I34_32180 [Streptomyces sp. MCA2]|uniref:hypothetical protein n=1 Tax=Streptomyces sp. MCA2 TaxID=2944805 RepID=UPI0020225FA4|nr:hypothetical protein [Streptomyces sp. MCA2]MCL7496027.1 hypothetical protein [Streptomyces sp. MCA2]